MLAPVKRCGREVAWFLIAIGVTRIAWADLTPTTFVPGDDAVGSLTDPADWTAGAPSASSHALVDAGNPLSSLVILSADLSATVGALSIDAGDTLWLQDGATLSVSRDAESLPTFIENNGLLRIGSSERTTRLVAGGFGLNLLGAGTVRLEGPLARLEAPVDPATGSLINVGNTIAGFGTIAGRMVNQSLITANVPGQTLYLNAQSTGTAGIVNTGILRAENGGTLLMQYGTYFNAGGIIEALDGSTVTLGSMTEGGTLRTFGTGIIQLKGYARNITNLGNLGGAGGFLEGTIVNSGIISVVQAGIGIEGEVTLTGGGSLELSSLGLAGLGGNSANARLINAADHTIRGRNELGLNRVAIVNHGLIEANRPIPLVFDSRGTGINDGTLRATSGAKLLIGGGAPEALDNTAGVIEALDGSTVTVNANTTVFGGTLVTAGSGVVYVGGTIRDLTNLGQVSLGGTIAGNIVNNGTMTVQATFVDGETMLLGAGIVALSDSNSARIIPRNAQSHLINGPNHVIRGTGAVLNLRVTNDGLINADAATPLELKLADGSANLTTMQATGGGALIVGGAVDNAGGTIQALAASTVQIDGIVEGGLVATSGSGQLLWNKGRLRNLTVSGNILVPAGADAQLEGTVAQLADILVDNATFRPVGEATLTGPGALVLAGGLVGNPVYPTDPTSRLINPPGHVIRGAGLVYGNHTNLGLIQANQAAPLIVDAGSGTVINAGIMEAAEGATLQLTRGTYINAGGTIRAQADSKVQILGGKVDGGTVSTVGTGVVEFGQLGDTTRVHLNNAILAGNISLPSVQTTLKLEGTITNNTRLDVRWGTGVDVLGDVTLAGNGTLTFEGALGKFGSPLGNLRNGPDHTLRGLGDFRIANSLINEGTFTLTGDIDMYARSGSTIVNSGTVDIPTGRKLRIDEAVYRQTAGTTTVNGSLLGYASPQIIDIQGGVLRGTGAVGGDVTNAGQISPGDSVGTLSLGKLVQKPTGSIDIELAGRDVRRNYDHLYAANTPAQLEGGTLNVSLVDGFSPVAGDSFFIFGWSGAAGAFASINLPALPGGLAWDTSALYVGGLLSVGAPGSYWNVDRDGNWSEAPNWSAGAPHGAGSTANFFGTITAPRVVSVDVPRTVGTLNFVSGVPFYSRYTIAGPETLVLDGGGDVHIRTIVGNHTISAPLSIATDNTVHKQGPGTLTISGPQLHGPGAAIAVEMGKLQLQSDGGSNLSLSVRGLGNLIEFHTNQHLESLAIDDYGGANANYFRDLTLAVDSLSIGMGYFNLYEGQIIVLTTPATREAEMAAVRDMLARGYGGGSWSGFGLVSSSAAPGAGKPTALGMMLNDDGRGGAYYTQFAGEAVDAGSILVKYTYYGDADLSGIVDGTDYALIDNGFNAILTGWFNGDFDYSGTIDGTDYALIDNAFNSQGAPLGTFGPVGPAVPEPSTLVLAALVGLIVLARARVAGATRMVRGAQKVAQKSRWESAARCARVQGECD